MKKSNKSNKRKKLPKMKNLEKKLLIAGTIVIIILLTLIIYKVYVKYISDNRENKIETIKKEELGLEGYNYYINSNATEYEKQLFEELKQVLSSENITEEEYAKALTKIFISDLFTLSSKNNSNDITSSQYIYDSYQETFKLMVKNTLYSNIEMNLTGNRNQNLPTITNVEISSIERKKFLLNNKVLDQEAFYITTTMEYEKDLDYPTTYQVVIVKNEDQLQIVKAEETK